MSLNINDPGCRKGVMELNRDLPERQSVVQYICTYHSKQHVIRQRNRACVWRSVSFRIPHIIQDRSIISSKVHLKLFLFPYGCQNTLKRCEYALLKTGKLHHHIMEFNMNHVVDILQEQMSYREIEPHNSLECKNGHTCV